MKRSYSCMLAGPALALLAVLSGCGAGASGGAGESRAAVAASASERETTAAAATARVPDRAEEVNPLKAGAAAPDATVRRPDGSGVRMGDLYSQKQSILIFYRGGWCPYCNTHLAQIAEVEPKLRELGYQVLAISPDRPEELRRSVVKLDLTYQLLSDSDAELAKAFGLAFRVDDATVEKYREYRIDLNAASGRDHHILPVPAVYVIDRGGTIRFAHANPDYKSRLEGDKLLAAARGAVD